MKVIIFDYYQTLFNPRSGRLYRGCYSMLKKLGSSKLILVTTYSPQRKSQILSLKLDLFFSQILIKKIKSLATFKKLISNPDQTLIIGDRPNSEIRIGKLLNCKTLQVFPQSENPVTTINNYLSKYL